MVTLEFPFTYTSYINPHFGPLRPHLCILALENKRRDLEWEFVWVLQELRGLWSSSKNFSFHRSVWNCKSKKKLSSHTILSYKRILSPNFSHFHSSNLMRLTFHCDCEKLIFDQISWNTSPNQIGLVSLWCRSRILSYEVKLIFSVFCRTFIIRAWFLVF